MILILSNNFDPSTSDVINWLDYQDVKWFRINETDKISLINIEIGNSDDSNVAILVNDEQRIDLRNVDAYWYRRGYLAKSEKWRRFRYTDSNFLQSSIYNTLQDDDQNAFEYLHHFLQDNKRNINSYLSGKNNKLYYLSKAVESGFMVPKTIVCTTKAELLSFYNNNAGKIICKSINEGFFFKSDDYKYFSHTNLVKLIEIESASETFFPSLFQRYIEKFIELRIFYCHDKIYSLAIFSQNNATTKIDIKNFDEDLPNREVSFCLPAHMVQKITKFMKNIQLNSGSLDMIITPANEYYFLEVNPVGQYGNVSRSCNYKIDKFMAEYLIAGNEK